MIQYLYPKAYFIFILKMLPLCKRLSIWQVNICSKYNSYYLLLIDLFIFGLHPIYRSEVLSILWIQLQQTQHNYLMYSWRDVQKRWKYSKLQVMYCVTTIFYNNI